MLSLSLHCVVCACENMSDTRENHGECDNKNEIYDLRLVIYLCANLLLQMVHVSTKHPRRSARECVSVGGGAAHANDVCQYIFPCDFIPFGSFFLTLENANISSSSPSNRRHDISIDTFCSRLHYRKTTINYLPISFLMIGGWNYHLTLCRPVTYRGEMDGLEMGRSGNNCA